MLASGTGGVGKSMISVNLAATLAIEGCRCCLVDMNIGLRTLDLYLGLENRAIFDVGDVFLEICTPEMAKIAAPDFPALDMIAGLQKNDAAAPTFKKLSKLIEHLKDEYDYVFIDCPSGINETIDVAMQCADKAIIIFTPDNASIRGADALEDYLIRNADADRMCIINKVVPALVEKGIEQSVAKINERMKSYLLGVILEDENIRASVGAGLPIVAKRDTYIAENFGNIAERLTKRPFEYAVDFG